MKENTRNRSRAVSRRVFTLLGIIGLIGETFIKMMPLTFFWMSVAASIYFDMSFSALLEHTQPLIKVSLIVNIVLSFTFSLSGIGNRIGDYYKPRAPFGIGIDAQNIKK